MRSFAVAALLPPANIERLVADLQDRLFRELSLPSAQALPAFAPLAALAPGLDPRVFESALAALRSGFRVELSAPASFGKAILLDLHLGPEGEEQVSLVCAALEAAASGAAAPQVPLPLGPRLWLAEAPSDADARAAVAWLAANGVPAAGFSSFEYAILQVDAADGELWWRELRWHTCGHVRTRRSRTHGGLRQSGSAGA